MRKKRPCPKTPRSRAMISREKNPCLHTDKILCYSCVLCQFIDNMELGPSTDQTTTKRKAEWFDIDDDHNTYVYVSGLPTTLTEEDFVDLMKRYGIIAKKTVPGAPYNIKLYKDKDGRFKGDALCRFVRVESVELALNHLDGYQFDEKHVLHCERAKFEMRGSYDPSKKPRIDQKAKQKQKKKIDKLLSWEPDPTSDTKQNKVILKYMFTPDEIEEDATLILDLKEDVEAKCTEILCEPKRVDIYDKHPDGVIAVTFAEGHQADSCVKALNNQFYAGRVVKAELWDGKTKYKILETDEESERRLSKWQQDIGEDLNETSKEEATSSEIK